MNTYFYLFQFTGSVNQSINQSVFFQHNDLHTSFELSTSQLLPLSCLLMNFQSIVRVTGVLQIQGCTVKLRKLNFGFCIALASVFHLFCFGFFFERERTYLITGIVSGTLINVNLGH